MRNALIYGTLAGLGGGAPDGGCGERLRPGHGTRDVRSSGGRPLVGCAGLPALKQRGPQHVGKAQRGERAVEVDDARRGAWPASGDVLKEGRLLGE